MPAGNVTEYAAFESTVNCPLNSGAVPAAIVGNVKVIDFVSTPIELNMVADNSVDVDICG